MEGMDSYGVRSLSAPPIKRHGAEGIARSVKNFKRRKKDQDERFEGWRLKAIMVS
jgi:hypothetical protein